MNNNIENLDFDNTLAAFKGSFRFFLLTLESQEKIINLITKVLEKKHYQISEKEILMLEHRISSILLDIHNEGYLANLDELLKKVCEFVSIF